MMPPHEHEQLLQAKTLIQQKCYDEARAILESLPFNKTAFEWLTKLDQIAPKLELATESVITSLPPKPSESAPPPPPNRARRSPEPMMSGLKKGMILIGRVLLIAVGFILAAFLRQGSLYDAFDDRFFGSSYEGQYLSVSYSGKWDEYAADWATYCQEPDENCFLTLILPDNPSTHASAMIFDFTQVNDYQAYLRDILDNYEGDSEFQLVRQSSVVVAGIESTVVHDIFYHSEDGPYYTMRVYIPVKNGVVQVNCWSQDAAVQEARIEDYLKVLGTIEWTEGTI